MNGVAAVTVKYSKQRLKLKCLTNCSLTQNRRPWEKCTAAMSTADELQVSCCFTCKSLSASLILTPDYPNKGHR